MSLTSVTIQEESVTQLWQSKLQTMKTYKVSVDVDLQLDDILASITSHPKSDRERNKNRKLLDSVAF